MGELLVGAGIMLIGIITGYAMNEAARRNINGD